MYFSAYLNRTVVYVVSEIVINEVGGRSTERAQIDEVPLSSVLMAYESHVCSI